MAKTTITIRIAAKCHCTYFLCFRNMCTINFVAINSLSFSFYFLVVPDIAAWKKMKLCVCVRACVWHFSYKNAGKLFGQIVHCVSN